MKGAAIMKRQRARPDEPTTQANPRSATIVRFPFTMTARPANGDGRQRPSLVLNILLILLLVLACVIWEAISSRRDHAHELHHSPVTSPLAAAQQGVA
jgi:hypothetical protein